MTNIIDYVHWRGDLTMQQSPLCAVDCLIYAQLVHAPLERLNGAGEGKPLSELTAAVYPDAPGKDENTLVKSRYELWTAMDKTPRFGSVTLARFESHFEPEAEKQFAGALFLLGDGTGVVSFRGTDATLTGWKEDFNMSFESPVPSQKEAVAFLEACAVVVDALYVCGHSKGGNLAMYSASMCADAVRAHIRRVYSFDGPGLDMNTLESAGYQAVRDRIHSYIPESSIIGLLMGHQEQYTIIDSDSVSLWQHNPYYWHVQGTNFLTAPDTTRSSRFTDLTLHAFLDSCTPAQRQVLVDTLFGVLDVTGVERLKDLPRGVATHLDDVLAAMRAVPQEDRQVVSDLLKTLADVGGDHVSLLWKGFIDRFTKDG